MKSIWAKSVNRKQFDSLSNDIKTDVLIVGGGMAGILCAHKLKKQGASCVLVEADRILGGVTENTTAKITVQHGLIYDDIISKYGVDAAKKYLMAQQDALNSYKELCQNIDCDFKIQDAFVYSLRNTDKLEREISAYKKIGLNYKYLKSVELPVNTSGAVCVANQAQFNPLKFALSLTDELTIYEKTMVIELFPGGAITDKGKVYAEKIIIATHFPFINKFGAYFLKMYQHRSYVIALEKAKIPNGMYIDEDEKGLSFREYNGLLLLGGGSHRTGKNGGNWKELRNFAAKYYPNSKEVAHFATQDCMTLDGIPYIGLYSKRLPNVYVATGFNKWGMTSSMAAATILADMINGKDNVYADVFSPQRSILHSQLAINMTETFFNFITPTVPRCPHLGCALKYNFAEHSWDCPCHGSRFREDGKLIENPATADKKM